jgi:hypothetical protein
MNTSQTSESSKTTTDSDIAPPLEQTEDQDKELLPPQPTEDQNIDTRANSSEPASLGKSEDKAASNILSWMKRSEYEPSSETVDQFTKQNLEYIFVSVPSCDEFYDFDLSEEEKKTLHSLESQSLHCVEGLVVMKSQSGSADGLGVYYEPRLVMSQKIVLSEKTPLLPYSGKIVLDEDDDEMLRYGVKIYPLDKKVNNHWIVDASQAGNEARFIRQSHAPNCSLQNVYRRGLTGVLPWVISLKSINPGDELTMFFNLTMSVDGLHSYGMTPCRCSVPYCPKWQETRPNNDYDTDLLSITSGYSLFSSLVVPSAKGFLQLGDSIETPIWLRPYTLSECYESVTFIQKNWEWKREYREEKKKKGESVSKHLCNEFIASVGSYYYINSESITRSEGAKSGKGGFLGAKEIFNTWLDGNGAKIGRLISIMKNERGSQVMFQPVLFVGSLNDKTFQSLSGLSEESAELFCKSHHVETDKNLPMMLYSEAILVLPLHVDVFLGPVHMSCELDILDAIQRSREELFFGMSGDVESMIQQPLQPGDCYSLVGVWNSERFYLPEIFWDDFLIMDPPTLNRQMTTEMLLSICSFGTPLLYQFRKQILVQPTKIHSTLPSTSSKSQSQRSYRTRKCSTPKPKEIAPKRPKSNPIKARTAKIPKTPKTPKTPEEEASPPPGKKRKIIDIDSDDDKEFDAMQAENKLLKGQLQLAKKNNEKKDITKDEGYVQSLVNDKAVAGLKKRVKELEYALAKETMEKKRMEMEREDNEMIKDAVEKANGLHSLCHRFITEYNLKYKI